MTPPSDTRRTATPPRLRSMYERRSHSARSSTCTSPLGPARYVTAWLSDGVAAQVRSPKTPHRRRSTRKVSSLLRGEAGEGDDLVGRCRVLRAEGCDDDLVDCGRE